MGSNPAAYVRWWKEKKNRSNYSGFANKEDLVSPAWETTLWVKTGLGEHSRINSYKYACRLFLMCKTVNYFKNKIKEECYKYSIPSYSRSKALTSKFSIKNGEGSFTFLYRVSSSTFMSRSCANTGGREGNGLVGFGSARILPSSPNHFLPWGSSRGKDNIFF